MLVWVVKAHTNSCLLLKVSFTPLLRIARPEISHDNKGILALTLADYIAFSFDPPNPMKIVIPNDPSFPFWKRKWGQLTLFFDNRHNELRTLL